MAAKVGDYVLDNGLTVLDLAATHIHIVDSDPTTFAEVATMSCGNKNFGAGACFAAPAPGTAPIGRQVQSAPITDGNVTRTATATGWAVTDTTNSRLLANGALSASQAVTNGNTFQLSQFIIKLPSGA
jgi:hypothetical protein